VSVVSGTTSAMQADGTNNGSVWVGTSSA
jgi:hypothetical protein